MRPVDDLLDLNGIEKVRQAHVKAGDPSLVEGVELDAMEVGEPINARKVDIVAAEAVEALRRMTSTARARMRSSIVSKPSRWSVWALIAWSEISLTTSNPCSTGSACQAESLEVVARFVRSRRRRCNQSRRDAMPLVIRDGSSCA